MSRYKGTNSYSANFEAQVAAPIDARCVVGELADLTLTSTWTANDGGVYAYKGMVVSVHSDTDPDNNGVYQLISDTYTDIANWVKTGKSVLDSNVSLAHTPTENLLGATTQDEVNHNLHPCNSFIYRWFRHRDIPR
jgi:hypothetical protein